MKKLVFASALVIGSLSAFAINSPLIENEMVILMAQEEFKEIELSEVPDAIYSSLAADNPEWKLTKAYVDEKEIYKLEVQSNQGETSTLYADKEGKWIQI
ncbi:MAG: hypothetical protein CO119_05615 [Flavobacteriales bacterium CG_4_9_14_3_um_filter_40_17]|nr:MAG: hypothetical protein CO119_05615 [Flavobacteriales bacterium CG_4_9_14_3_um_filter_40_17]